MMRLLLTLVLSASLGCRSMPPNALRDTQPGELQREFASTHPEERAPEYEARCDEPYENNTGITEIAIERTPCYGFCPTYTLRFFSDGRVEFLGQASVKFVGSRRGRLDEHYFTQLARTAVGIGFFELNDRYACGVSDSPTVYVAVARGAERKTIEHYAPIHTGPAALRLFEEAVDDVLQYVDWSPN